MLKKILILLFLAVLTASAFFIRLENFPRPNLRTIDELVYYNLGRQMMRDPFDYSSKPYGENLQAKGRTVPDYFMRPLFKHPPLFPGLTALVMKVMGDHPIAGGMVAIIFGALLIPLTYLLAARVFDRRTGLLSALMIYMDPVTIICSQKVWMETTLVFFMTLTLYLAVRAVESRRAGWFIAGGIAGGLAFLTKYPGLLAQTAFFLYAVLFNRPLLRNKTFWWGLGMTFLVFSPWILWNYEIYGGSFLRDQARLHDLLSIRRCAEAVALLLGGVVVAAAGMFAFQHPACRRMIERVRQRAEPWLHYAPEGLLLVLAVILIRPILLSLQWDHIPAGSWVAGFFRKANILFYPGKLIEFSFIYALGFLSFYFCHFPARPEIRLIKTAALLILVFFTAWGNFQSRYILPAMPLLIILGAHAGVGLWDRFSSRPQPGMRALGRMVLLLLLFLILLRGQHMNLLFSFPHDVCYF